MEVYDFDDGLHVQIAQIIETLQGERVAVITTGADIDTTDVRIPPPEVSRRERYTWWVRQQMRANRLVPVYFSVEDGVPNEEANAARQGIEDVLVASGQARDIVVVAADALPAEEFYDPDQQAADALRQQKARRDSGYGPQLDMQLLLDEIERAEPYQEPHLAIRLSAHDLTAEVAPGEYVDFAVGATDPHGMVTIQSIARFMAALPSGKLRQEIIRRLFRHETGHLFGVPSSGRRNIQYEYGLHCTNVCTMRQAIGMVAWGQYTVEESRENVHFCADCQQDLNRATAGYRPL
jgi:hypothetical protein